MKMISKDINNDIMKRNYSKYLNAVVLLLLASLFCLTSCKKDQTTITIRGEFNETCTPKQQSEARKIITQRLNLLPNTQVKTITPETQNSFKIVLVTEKGAPSRESSTIMSELFSLKGELYVTETYELKDLYQRFVEANAIFRKDSTITLSLKREGNKTEASTKEDSLYNEYFTEEPDKYELQNKEWAKENPLFAVLAISSMAGEGVLAEGPAVGTANIADTATISAMLGYKDVKALFPRDIAFYWTKDPVDEKGNYFNLIAIKKNRPFYINSETTESFIGRDHPNSIIYDEISIQFKKEEHALWAKMTRENVGRSLAIVLDNAVMNYPRVNSEITGGAASITGTDILNHIQVLTAIVMGGTLNSPLQSWDVIDIRTKK